MRSRILALSMIAVLAIVASFLWWRLSHAETASQPGKNSASAAMEEMAQAPPANTSRSKSDSASQAATSPAEQKLLEEYFEFELKKRAAKQKGQKS